VKNLSPYLGKQSSGGNTDNGKDSKKEALESWSGSISKKDEGLPEPRQGPKRKAKFPTRFGAHKGEEGEEKDKKIKEKLSSGTRTGSPGTGARNTQGRATSIPA